jgi:hypothetical protein
MCGRSIYGVFLTDIEVNVRDLGAIDSILCV